MSRFNILRNANIRNSMSCRYDTNEGYAVVWKEENDFKQYTEFSGITTRLVANQNYFAVATSGICYVSPVTDQATFDAGSYDTVNVTYRVEVGFNQTAPTTGRIQFQTEDDPAYDEIKIVDFPINPDNAYNKYTVDMSQFKEWAGSITRIRLYPFIDGSPGNIIHLKSISVQSSSNHACSSQYDGGGLCSRFSQYSHPCPWTGAGGSCQSTEVNNGIDILEGVNDEIVVNINGYGDQKVTLKPTRGALLKNIASDLEDKLSNIGIAGYAGNRTEEVLQTLLIVADDTREVTSTVVVKDTAAARTLGFYDDVGNTTHVATPGEDAASRYEPAGTVQLSKAQIAQFYVPDQSVSESVVTIDPQDYATEAGRPDFASVTREQYIDFIGKTIIDFNHPVSQTGTFTFFGYSGDATSLTELLFLRPSSNGGLTLLGKQSLSATGSLTSKVFNKTINVKLRKGDLLGIYDGRIYTGGDAEHPNVSYFIHDGQLSIGDFVSFPKLYGNGDEGLQLYARGRDRQTGVVLDIEFEQPELIEEIQVIAVEETREEIINLSRTLSGGLNGGPYITGETGLDKFGAQAPSLTNLAALTDGVNTNTPTASIMHPSWLDSPFSPADKYEQTEFSVVLDFAKAVPVFFNIFKVIMYFRDTDNIKMFRIDYPLSTNEFDTDINWGPVSGKFDYIALDGKQLLPDSHPLYSHPMQVTSDTLTHTYRFLEYNSLEMQFPPVRARSLKYGVKNYFFNEDVSSFDLSNFALAQSPNILEMEVYATSTPKATIADNFFFESINEQPNFVTHKDVRVTGATSANYLIGYPVRKIRAHVVPQGKLDIKSFGLALSQSPMGVKTNVGGETIALQLAQDDFDSFETATITNASDKIYNYYIDISPQRNAVERCLLWNKMGTEEQLTQSQIGPSFSVAKRDDFRPRETNFSLNVPGYIIDPFWMLNRNIQTYISYNHGATWERRGNVLGNYNYDPQDELNSKNPEYQTYTFVYILIDLGDVYAPKTVEMVRRSGTSAVADFSGSILYSSNNVDTPEELDIINDFIVTQGPCRWLRLRGVSVSPSATSGVPTINFVRVTVDPLSPLSFNKMPWVPAPKLTNYIFGQNATGLSECGEGWHCRISPNAPLPPHYYAVDLENHYDPYNILTGPQSSDALALTKDIDKVLPGGTASRYTANSRANGDIAYGFTATDDPNKVYWGNFGAEPPEYTRWILLKEDGWLTDEVVVFINDNDVNKKPLFGSERWWTALLGTVKKDYSITPSAGHSMSVDYVANQGPAIEEIEVQQSFGIDDNLAKKDQLKVMLYVSDVSQLDLSQGHIAIGRNTTESNGGALPLVGTAPDRTNYFQWNFSDMPGLINTGWNELYLPFTDNFREGQPFFTRDDYLSLSPSSVSGRSRLRWFRVNFAGVPNNKEFSVKVADLEHVRGDFLPAKFGNGYYLANGDYARLPLSNFNTLQGTVEFYLRPDWTKTPGCNTCDDPRDHTIFRFFNSDDFMLGLFMTGEGLRVYTTNGAEESFYLTDNDSPQYIFSDVNTHIAVTWDFLGERSDKGVAIYVNGKLSSSIAATNTSVVKWHPNPDVVFMLGGSGWDGVITTLSSSVDGIIDNLKIFNYAKSDFSYSLSNQGLEYIRASDELIEISVDGINFYGSESRGTNLPLLVRNVDAGQEFKIYIRNKEQTGPVPSEGQERTGYLEIVKARPG